MKKLLLSSLLSCVAVSLVCALWVSCSKGGKAGSSKLESISLMVNGVWLAPDNGEDIPERGFETLTGIDLVLNHPPHNEYPQKLDLAFTTGEIPDVFLVSAGQYNRYASAGALYDMTEFYDNSKMKNNMVNQDIVDVCRIKGRLYGIPYSRGNGTLTYVRGDWLKKLGMSVPTNYDEFLAMLRAFKNKNPDGLKPKQVIPITGPGLANKEYPMDIYLREFYQDATPDYVEKNGKWVDGMLQPEMKGALKRMVDAYKEGLIDAEIITNQTSTCRDKFYSGSVGVFNYWAGYWNDRIYNNTKPNVPDVEVLGIPAIKETIYIERPPGIICMSSKVKDPEGIFENFFELINDMGPGQNNFCFGIEGESYVEKDGIKEFLPTKLNPEVPYNKVFVDPSLVVTKWTPKWVRDPLTGPSYETFRKTVKQYGLPNPSEELGKLQTEINQIKMNYISKIVFGDFTVANGLKKYAEEIKKYNDAVLPDMNNI